MQWLGSGVNGCNEHWLQRTPNPELEAINSKLLIAKGIFPQFWRLKQDVRNYFINNAQNPEERPTLQTIELLCNARALVQELSLDRIRTLANLLNDLVGYVRSTPGV